MPRSDTENKIPVINLLAKHNCKNILELGTGWGDFGSIIKKETPDSKIFGIEIYKPYFEKINHEYYEDIFNEDIRNFDYRSLNEKVKFDTVLCIDVLEHLEREEGIILLKKLEEIFSLIIVSVPIIDYIQGAWEGNEYETHRTQWKVNELVDLNYSIEFRGLIVGVFYKKVNNVFIRTK